MSAAAFACLKHSARISATDCPCARCAHAAEIDHANVEASKATATRVFELVIVISLSGFRDDAPPKCSALSGDHLGEEEESPPPFAMAVRQAGLTTLALDASAATSADGRLTLLAGLVRTVRISLPSSAPRCALRVCRRSKRYHTHRHCH
jgi:hypothetical protein